MTVEAARDRARTEITREITTAARRQLASDGADRLSLRSVAREVGLVPSAVYRYFPSKDDLVTALVVDSFSALARFVERAVRGTAQPADAFVLLCRAVRTWGRRHLHEWALLYGAPVPGYRAPQSTVEPGTRVFRLLLAVLVDSESRRGPRRGRLRPSGPVADARLTQEAVALSEALGVADLPPRLFVEVVACWAQLVGAVSAEVFGHLDGSFSDLGLLFDHTIAGMAGRLSLA